MDETKQEKLPIDGRLLSEAVIELNISRRSVGLYPPEHPILKSSIEKAFELLRKLFEMRSSITLAIAKDALVIDEYTVDKKNYLFTVLITVLAVVGSVSYAQEKCTEVQGSGPDRFSLATGSPGELGLIKVLGEAVQ